MQILLAKHRLLLGKLRSTFQVSTAVVPEVEAEVRNHRKFRRQFEPEFMRAVTQGDIFVLDEKELKKLLEEKGFAPPRVTRFIDEIAERGSEYHEVVGLGEAYTHAAASLLDLPVFSHDRGAVDVLESKGLPVGQPVIQFFDLLVLARSEGWIDDTKCEAARKFLEGRGEFVPRCFRRTSFLDGLREFNRRLVRSTSPRPPMTGANSVLGLIQGP